MLCNFKIEDSVGLRGENFYFDLHNDYDLHSFSFSSMINKNLIMLFRKTEGDWTKEKDPKQVRVQFNQIDYFEVSESFFTEKEAPVTIEEFGFKTPTDMDYDWLVRDEQREPNSQYHFIIRMSDSNYIRIGCTNINVEEVPLIIQLERSKN